MARPPGVPEGLWTRLQQGVSALEGVDRVRVLCHYDGDGATSAAILTRALVRSGRRAHVSLTSVLDDEVVARVKEESNVAYVIADMGSSQLDAIEGLGRPAVVLDHHKPLRDSESVVHANAHLFGVDGAHGACGATMSWAFALAMDAANWDSAGVAMAGAIADRQDTPAYDGLNAPMFEEAVRRELLHRDRRPALPDRPLGEAITSSYLPYFAGLSNRPDEVASTLRQLGIDGDAAWPSVEPPKRRALMSFLTTRLMQQGAAPEAIDALVRDTHVIGDTGRTARDLSEAVNACCRMREEGVATALALGDPAATRRADEHLKEYTRKVLEILDGLRGTGPHKRKHLGFFYCDESTLAGNVAGIVVGHLWGGALPILSLSVVDGTTRVSARGTKALVEEGLNLATALREGASSVGGRGGGHDIASGATIPKGKEEKFLAAVDERIGAQLSPKPSAAAPSPGAATAPPSRGTSRRP